MSVRHALAASALGLILGVIAIAQPSATGPTTAPATRSYNVAGHGDLRLTIPASWSESEDAPQPGMPRTIRITDDQKNFELLVSILPPPKGVTDFNSPAKLRAVAEAQGKHVLATSKETSVVLEEVTGPNARGFVYTLTDKSPAPGAYGYITGGVIGVGDLILSMTMLMREKNPPHRATALQLLADASQVSATTSPSTQEANRTLAVALPGRKWHIAIDRPGLKALGDELSPDHQARHVSLVDPTTGVNIAIFFEPAATIGDAKTARRFYFDRLKRSPLLIRDERMTEPGDAARVDYFLPDANQRHANIYFAKETVWVDVHISVEDTKGDKQGLIDEIAVAVTLKAKPESPAPTK